MKKNKKLETKVTTNYHKLDKKQKDKLAEEIGEYLAQMCLEIQKSIPT